MICMKNLRFSSRPRAKVRRQGPPGSARAQPWWAWPNETCFLLFVGDVIVLGKSDVFKFNYPTEAAKLREKRRSGLFGMVRFVVELSLFA